MWRSARTAGSGKGGAASLLASWRVPGFLARYGWRVFQPCFQECEQEEYRGPGLAWLVPYSGCGVARLQPFRFGSGDALFWASSWATGGPGAQPCSLATGALGTLRHARFSRAELGDH